MCGRLNIRASDLTQMLLEFLGEAYSGEDNFNAAPTENIPVLRMNEEGSVELTNMRWWLTPSWAREPSTQYSMFNAKSETAATSPAFSGPYAKQRCVVPVSGFYEWCREQGQKVPYLIHGQEEKTLLLAGLWDCWSSRGTAGGVANLYSFTLLTTAAHEKMQEVHHRQPVFLTSDQAKSWLDMAIPTTALEPLFASKLPIPLHGSPVSTWVNSSRNKDQRCHQVIGPALAIEEPH
jgi:putative SOS response-associated peptidase YedK